MCFIHLLKVCLEKTTCDATSEHTSSIDCQLERHLTACVLVDTEKGIIDLSMVVE